MLRGIEGSGNPEYFIDTSIKKMNRNFSSSQFFRVENATSNQKNIKIIKVDNSIKKFFLQLFSTLHIIDKPVYKTAHDLSELHIFKSESGLSESAKILALISLSKEAQDGAVPSDHILDNYNESEKVKLFNLIKKTLTKNLKNNVNPNLKLVNTILKKECSNKPINEKIRIIYFNGVDFTKGTQNIKLLANHLLKADNPLSILDSLHLPDPILHQLALYINNHRFKLKVLDFQPIMQRVLAIICEHEVPKSEKSLIIHKKLYHLQKIPSDYEAPSQNIKGIEASINLAQLRNVKSTTKIKREDLPAEATIQAWRQLTENLKRKVENNPQALENLESYGTTWTAVWMGCLHDSHLTNLLTTSEENVSLTEAKFRAILSNLLAQDTSTRKDQFFTEQEEVLIKTAMTIKNCSTGKNQAIDLVYGALDSKYHYQVKLLNSQEDRPIQFITDIVKRVISDQFKMDNPPFLQELTGQDVISHCVHQVLYTKNLIGNVVGLDHELVIERPRVLLDKLVKTPREEVLATFFKYVTPTTLVNELMKTVNSDLNKNSAIINPMLDSAEFWDEQEDFSYTLNELGAIKLLQITGFLTQV